MSVDELDDISLQITNNVLWKNSETGVLSEGAVLVSMQINDMK